jgi:hypothetical protein
LVANALNLPFEIVHGTLDELVPVGGFMKTVADFTTAGNAFRSYQHLLDDHLTFAAADEWGRTRDWLGNARRDRDPLRVRYKRYPVMDLPQHGLRFDRAYWVSELQVRDARAPDSWGAIDATTLARGGHERDPATPVISQQAVPGSSPAIVVDRRSVQGAAIPRANGFRATLRNIAMVRLDLRRMGIDATERVTATLGGDGPTVLRLTGAFPPRTIARLDGVLVPIRRDREGVRVTVDLTGGRPDHPRGGLDLTAGGQLHRLVVSRAGG